MARDRTSTSPKQLGQAQLGRARRLIAGLRISQQEAALLAVVRPFFPEVASEGELAYRLWRRGLELTLAEAASLGVVLPPGTSEEVLAGLVAQRLLLCLPLLRRTATLSLLHLEPAPSPQAPLSSLSPSMPLDIDEAASAAVAQLGGAEFL